MKTKKLSPAKTLLLASASKLAFVPGMASAQGGGKEEPPPEHLQPLKFEITRNGCSL
jgi:hypothetical protein